jgi:hypothetical protein
MPGKNPASARPRLNRRKIKLSGPRVNTKAPETKPQLIMMRPIQSLGFQRDAGMGEVVQLFIEDDLTMQKGVSWDKPYPTAAARGSAALDFAGVSRTPTAATIAASAANPARAYRPPAKVPVISRRYPMIGGDTLPPRMPTELVRCRVTVCFSFCISASSHAFSSPVSHFAWAGRSVR